MAATNSLKAAKNGTFSKITQRGQSAAGAKREREGQGKGEGERAGERLVGNECLIKCPQAARAGCRAGRSARQAMSCV